MKASHAHEEEAVDLNDSAPTQELNIGEIDPSNIPADVTSEQPETVNEAPVATP